MTEESQSTAGKAGKPSRGAQTRQALMRSAENLIAMHGIEHVTIREIVQGAGQKNESALQYHFGNLDGLIEEIIRTRSVQTQAKRATLLEEVLAANPVPDLRSLCRVMVAPPFLLAGEDPGFRQYVIAFGHRLTLADESALSRVTRRGGGGESGKATAMLLQAALPHLDIDAYSVRMDNAIRLVSASMGQHARAKDFFTGPDGEYWLSNMIDAVQGLLSVPVSAETRALAQNLGKAVPDATIPPDTEK